MPLGIIEDDAFESELDNLSKSEVKSIIQNSDHKGRSEGDNNVPESLRKIIGEESITGDRQSSIALANDFGISPSSTSAYSNGSTSTKSYNDRDKDLTNHLDKIKEKITTKASSRLVRALNEITPEKLADIKPKDAASIAKDMSVIIRNMEPEKKEESRVNSPNFIFYAPNRMRKESEFEVIEVSE